jgi:hypothetical protein
MASSWRACYAIELLTATQRGIAGEELFAACVTLTSGGDLELFKTSWGPRAVVARGT